MLTALKRAQSGHPSPGTCYTAQVLWGTQAIHGELVGTLQDLERLLEAGRPLWENAMALERYLSNKPSLSSPDRPSPARDTFRAITASLPGEAGGQIQARGRRAWLDDSQFLTLLNAILCSLLFSEVFGPASSRGMKRLSQHVGFLLPAGAVCSQQARNPV